MTKKSLILASALLFAVALGCENETATTPAMKLTPVLVESGNISGITFTSSGAFKATDNAIGSIDSVDVSLDEVNGYADTKNNIYIFEGGKVPQEFKALSAAKLYDRLANATWKESGSYTLEHDALIYDGMVRFKYIFREKGTHNRQEASVLGSKIYKYTDKIIIEDYIGFLDFHEYIRTQTPVEEYYKRIGISPKEYRLRSDNPEIYDDKSTTLPSTDLGLSEGQSKSGFLFFESNTGKPTIRLRVVFFKYETNNFQKFFANKKRTDGLRVLPALQGQFSEIIKSDDPSKDGVRVSLQGKMSTEKTEFHKFLINVLIDKSIKIGGYTCNGCDLNSKKFRINGVEPPPNVGHGG